MDIDGSEGEGGGQILRVSTALSALTGRPIRIFNIRAKRPKPGLAMQHLTAVRAVADVCGAEVDGLAVGSKELSFSPKKVAHGTYDFDVGTAGAVTLVLQACVVPLVLVKGRSVVRIRGGTDVPYAPSIDYFIHVLSPMLAKMGIIIECSLEKRGYNPMGGGIVEVSIEGLDRSELRPLRLVPKGEMPKVKSLMGLAHVTNLPFHIAEREANSATRMLSEHGLNANIKAVEEPGIGDGTGITLWAELEDPSAIIGACSLGKRGVRAEEVGACAAMELSSDLLSFATVDVHLADQLLPFMAYSETSEFLVRELSSHLHTSVRSIERFLGARFAIEKKCGLWSVRSIVIR